jgi:hypothetical protein
MTVIINGTDNSASTPAVTGTDGDTGMFYPAANTVALSTGGSERMRVDSSGNVGIGTSSPASKLDISTGGSTGTTDMVTLSGLDAGSAKQTYGVIRMGIEDNTAGSEDGNLHLQTVEAGTVRDRIFMKGGGEIGFYNGGTERARITSGGFLKASNTGSYFAGNVEPAHVLQSSTSETNSTFIVNSSASPYGLYLRFTGASPNNATNYFFACDDSTPVRRAFLLSNGGFANYSANDANLSDRREKTNFAPAKNYLDTICAIPVQTFNYIDQNLEEDDGITLGVVAQDVQEVAPELVMESNWGTQEEPKMRLSIYQTDLQYALMKSIQELKAINDAQAQRIETLEAKVAALEGAE